MSRVQRTKVHVQRVGASVAKGVRHSKHLAKKAHHASKVVHHHVARRPHEHLSKNYPKYKAWHQHRHHTKVHYAILGFYVIVVAVFSILAMRSVSALSTWTQSDWSGGVGASTTNQYASGTNVDTTTTAGQLATSNSEKLTNTGFESNVDSWDGGVAPSSISGLRMWFKADAITGLSDGASVSTWNDSSGNGWNAGQNGATALPTYKTNVINGKPAVRFGNSGVLNSLITSSQTLSNRTSFVVLNTLGSPIGSYQTPLIQIGSPYNQFYASGNSTWIYYAQFSGISTSINASGLQLLEATNGASGGVFYINGIQRGTGGGASPSITSTFQLGSYTPGNYGSNADIAEILIFDSVLSTTDRKNIESYLQAKYAVSAESVTVTRDTATKRTGSASAKLVAGPNGGSIVQSANVGDTNSYNLVSYAYTDGSAVTSSDVELSYNGSAVSTTYTSVGSGWYKLSATVTGANASRTYGVLVKANKTVYVDDMSVNTYNTSSTLTSNILDTGVGSAWGTLGYTANTPAGTTASVKVRAGNNADLSDATAFNSCSAVASGADLTGGCTLDNKRYVQYQVSFTSTGENTATLQDLSINYSPHDSVVPDTNASAIAMLKAAGGDNVASNAWTNGASPYFSWTAGADDDGGSGIKGYCLYLGTDNSADPVSTKGLLGTSPVDTSGSCQFAVSSANVNLATSGYIGTALSSSNSPYYLKVKAIDNANNVYVGSSASFQFRFDNTAPTNPSFISAPSQFVSSKAVALTWQTSGGDAPADSNSGVSGLQYRIGNAGTWYGDSHSGSQDSSDLLTNDGTYTTTDNPDFANINEGNNIVAFRTYDEAGNISSTFVTTVIKLNTSSPSSPQNVDATPATNTTNSFAFSWSAPSSFEGSANTLTYCYTVNAVPTSNNCTYTAAGITSLSAGAYATQPGENTFYVVAKDEAGNINYATAATTTFTANTPAPGMPLNMEIADVSSKDTSSWKLALSWNAPSDTGSGVSSYKVFRSTNNTSFSQIASTAGTSYVDTGLSQVTYYYKVRACDSANNCGAYSSTSSKLPTGRFTTAANLVNQPSVTVSTRKASITWSTDRTSDSRVQIGTTSGQYQGTESANSTQTKVHSIDLENLTAGTTYYYKAKWTDEDGNIGISSELSFSTLPAPTVKEVTTQRVALSSANINFTAVNATQVKLYYGKSEGFGGLKTINTSVSESSYLSEIAGLDDGTKYFYRLNPVDADGNEYEGTVLSFTTPARPRISNLRFQPVEGEPTSTQKVTWDTNVPSTSLVRYSTAGEPNKESASSTLATQHEVTMTGLKDDSEYSLIAESRDADGNLAISDSQTFKTALDTRPPKISNLKIETTIRGVGTEARGQIIVSWKTDEPATGQVAYAEGASGNSYTSTTAEDAALSTEHTVIISDLTTSQVYHLQPISYDKARNVGKGEDRSAIIGAASDSVIDIILGTLEKIFGL